MLYFLSDYTGVFGPFRLFEFVTFRAGGAALMSFLLVLFYGRSTAQALSRLNVRATERLEGLVPPEFIDKEKAKTPCMGGLLVIGSILISALYWTDLSLIPLVLIGGTFLMALTGFIDDFLKVWKKDPNGMPGRVKMLMLTVIAAGVVYGFSRAPEMGSGLLRQLMVPFFKEPVWSGSLLYVLEVVVIVGASNAVNLTDGKDGLASGCTIFCTLTYAVFAYVMGHRVFSNYLSVPYIAGAGEAVVFASAVCGSCIGFLWHNCHPASMFMGDTGSLALGGAVGMLAVLARQELLLVLVGGVFVMEAVSVILQVGSFKLTGKRIFLCTPIHHHFERKGWTETQIVVRFWILAGVFALLALATLKLR